MSRFLLNNHLKRRIFLAIIVVLAVLTIYYWSLISYGIRQGAGQLNIVWSARPVAEALADPDFPDSLKARLRIIDDIRQFAIDSLGLKDTDNYKTIYDQKGEEVMWVVTAAEAFQLKPKMWDFPVVGSVPYKGYFDKDRAIREATKLKEEGWDVSIRNPGGWSTLGWFTDPILTGMLDRSEGDLASLIIHEMVHATLWVPDSVEFNENLASFIGDTAAYAFLRYKYGVTSPEYERYLFEDQDYRKFSAFALRAAKQADSLYTNIADHSPEEKKKEKEAFIRSVVTNMDTLDLRLNKQPSKRYEKQLPNNTWFMLYRNYQSRQPVFKNELDQQFNGDIKQYIDYLRKRYPVG